MKKVIFLLLLFSFVAKAQTKETLQISKTLDNWHLAAAHAKLDDYMAAMMQDAVYMGTDATEYWNKTEFMAFAKPYFDKGKAWSFTALERHIYFSKDKKTAWFDELLDTQMKICRGSGVLVKVGNDWKIQHYVLSMTIPNDNSDEVTKIKEKMENPLIEKLKSKTK